MFNIPSRIWRITSVLLEMSITALLTSCAMEKGKYFRGIVWLIRHCDKWTHVNIMICESGAKFKSIRFGETHLIPQIGWVYWAPCNGNGTGEAWQHRASWKKAATNRRSKNDGWGKVKEQIAKKIKIKISKTKHFKVSIVYLWCF